MSRAEDTHATNLKNIFNTIEDAGYSAIMLVYDPLHADYLIKTAHALNKNHNLKYIFAMRAYAISPEYCAMITNAYDEIVPGKLIFNIAAGDEFQMKNNEVGLDGVVDGEILLNNNDINLILNKEVDFKIDSGWSENFSEFEKNERNFYYYFTFKISN